MITTVAGAGTPGFSGDGGPAKAANLFFPTGLAFNARGDLFFADRYSSRIRVIRGPFQ
jgi:hypothetical protein